MLHSPSYNLVKILIGFNSNGINYRIAFIYAHLMMIAYIFRSFGKIVV